MNPLAQPATVLEGSKSLDAYEGYVDKVIGDVEKKKQLEALKQAKVDEALLPPDVNIDDVYRVQTDEIVGQMNELLRTKVDLMSTGVDVESPEYARQIQQAENNLLGQVVKSKQQRALDESVLKTLADPKASELYDYEATTKKLAEYRAAADKGVKSGDDWLSQNGSILVPKAFDPYAYGAELSADYEASVSETDPTRKGGVFITETLEEQTPENYLGAGERFLYDPKAKNEAQFIYDSLSADKKAEYDQKAILAGGQAGDGVKMFAAEKYIAPNWKSKKTNEFKTVPKGGGGGNTNKTPTSNLLVDQVIGVMTGNPNYIKTDANGYNTTDAFSGQTIGSFQERKIVGYEPSVADPNVGDLSKPIYEAATKPIVIQQVVQNPKDGFWYIQTNESVANKKGKSVAGYNNMVKYGKDDFKNLTYKLATQTGEWTSEDIDAYAESKGMYNADKSFNVADPTPKAVDIFFNGKTEQVTEAPKIVNGVKVFKLSDGTWVKWDKASDKWIKSQYQGEAEKKPAKTTTTTTGKVR
jgi:hypothetical protein